MKKEIWIVLIFVCIMVGESMRATNENIKVILIHGNGNSTADNHWFPIVSSELKKCGLTVIACQFPDTYFAYAHTWLPFLKNELKADENTILIGHSSGAVAAMRFAQENKILGSILVGSYYTTLGLKREKVSGYFDTPWNWDVIKENQNWIIQFASMDDPWIPIEEPRFIHKQLQSDYYEFNDQSHFDKDCHKSSFPELIEAIKKKLLYN